MKTQSEDPRVDAVARLMSAKAGILPIDPIDGGSNYWAFWQLATEFVEKHAAEVEELMNAIEARKEVSKRIRAACDKLMALFPEDLPKAPSQNS